MNVYDFTVKDIEGNDVPLSRYKGKTLLIINSATDCRFTAQYPELQRMYQAMKDRDFEILDFPCDQFLHQAPGTSEHIHDVCTARFSITFPQFAKIDVVGPDASPLFVYLQKTMPFDGFGLLPNALSLRFVQKKVFGDNTENTDIRWNFTKFLISPEGDVVTRFEPTIPADMVHREINRYLNGEELSIKAITKSLKEKEYASFTEDILTKQRHNNANKTFVVAYAVLLVFILTTLVYVKYDLHFMDVLRSCLAACGGAFIFSLGYNILNKMEEMKINKLCYALEQATAGNYDYRLAVTGNERMERPYSDYNKMCDRLKDTRERMEEAIEDAEAANQAKSNFLSNMSHEIRTPLNAVLGLDEMIIRESTEDEIVAYATDIRNAGKTLLSLINDILDLSKVEAGKMELVPVEYDLSSVINDIINMVSEKAKAKGLQLNINVDRTMPHLLIGDEVRIKQICLNILNNAVKYTDAGSVSMTVGQTMQDGTFAITFSVADTGQGIKEEDMARLFEPFARIEEKKNRNVEGTGLGMSITKNLLALMDSKLSVESTYGKGSTFSFVVAQQVVKDEPIGDFAESYRHYLANQKKYQESFRAPSARILVVDDVEMNLTVVKNFLKKTEVMLDTAMSGRQALELGDKTKYDLIFVDHMMPDMDGFETLAAFRSKGPNMDTPICVLTANAVSGAREQYMAAGFDDYLTKPIDSFKLEQLIIKMLPEDKCQLMTADEASDLNEVCKAEQLEQNPLLEQLDGIEGIDVASGISACGGVAAYMDVAENFTTTGPGRLAQIKEYYEALDIKNYTIQVHALKSSARLLGHMALSRHAKALEAAGNADDRKRISSDSPLLLQEYQSLLDTLTPLFAADTDKPPVDDKYLKKGLCSLYEALLVFDMDMADSIMESLDEYLMPADFAPVFDEIKALMAEVERDKIMQILEEIDGK